MTVSQMTIRREGGKKSILCAAPHTTVD